LRRSAPAWRLAAAATAALATGAIAASPAAASLTGPGVEDGQNITVFHNIDFIAIFGYAPVGQTVTIDVIRDGVTIGTTTGPTVDTPEGPGLEANHGPAGAPQPGDCWEGHTPDILPGDRIVVSEEGGDTDEVTVDDIRFTGSPTLQDNGDITVSGIARRADGTPIPASFLDSGEFRDTSKFRGAPNQVIQTPGTVDGFTMVYKPPYMLDRNDAGLDENGRRQSLLGDGHAIGFGHVVPLPLESMLVDGVADTPGPALGCEASASEANSVLSADDDAVNLGSGSLMLTGSKMTDADDVTVTLTSSGGGTTGALSPTITGNDWTLEVTAAELAALQDGTITAAGQYNHAGDVIGGRTLEIGKDMVAPAIQADLAPGTYVGVQSLNLSAGAGEKLEYNLDGGPSFAAYKGALSLPVGSTTVTARATDAAGNVTRQQFAYVIEAPPAPAAAPAPVVVTPLAPATQVFDVRAMRVTSFVLRRSYRLGAVRYDGLGVLYKAPAGADAVTFAIYRAGSRKPVAKRTVRARGTGRQVVRLRSKRFRAGRHTLEIQPSRGGQAGQVTKKAFRITR